MAESSNPDWASQWQALARPWLDAWKDFAPGAVMPQRNEAFEQWSRLFGAATPQGETLERMLEAARNQAAFMQSMLATLASTPDVAPDWAEAMRKALGGNAMFQHPAAERWREGSEQVRDFIAPMLRSAGAPTTPEEGLRSLLDMPAFGPAREQQEHYQRTGKAWLDYREQLERYGKLMLDAAQRGFAHFERKLAEHEQPGRQIDSLRALYDLWVDAAEEGYAEVALSPELRTVYGELTNAQMRLRSELQKETERVSRELGMPTRSEVETLGQRLQALRREVRGRSSDDGLAAEVAALRAEVAALKAERAAAARAAKASAAPAPAAESVLREEAVPVRKAAATRKAAPAVAAKAAPAKAGGAAGSFAAQLGKYAASSLGTGRAKPAAKKTAAKRAPARKLTARRSSRKENG